MSTRTSHRARGSRGERDGTHQASEDDGEEVEVDRGVGQAPEHKRADAADDGADRHEGRVWDAVREVPGDDLADGGRGVEKGEDDRRGKFIGQRSSEHGDVERDREVCEPL